MTGAPGRLETAVDQAQDFPKQVPRHDNLGQMEPDIATMRWTASSTGILNLRSWPRLFSNSALGSQGKRKVRSTAAPLFRLTGTQPPLGPPIP